MNKKYIGIVAGLLMLAGCSNNENIMEPAAVNGGGMKTFSTFTATLGDVADTRAYLVEGENGMMDVNWQDDDCISVFSENDTLVYEIMDYNANIATFGGHEISGNEFHALYPAWNWSPSEENPNVWYTYLYNGNSASSNNDFRFWAPMVAKSSDNVLNFKQTTGLIHVSVGDIYSLSEVIIRGNNDEILGDRGYVDLSEDEPVFRIDERYAHNTSVGVWFDYQDPVPGDVKDIYFFVPPTTFERGFTLDIYGYDEDENWISYTKSTTQRLVVDRATVKHFTLVNVEAELEETEARTRAALTAFYEALDGENWYYVENWNTDAPLDQWEGLYFEDGVLRGIDLSGYNLTGAIPAAIADIPTLEWLELSHNHITAFPEDITLPCMRRVWMGYNEMEGPLPESFANMPLLEDLFLDNNLFVGGIPDSYFTNLNNLGQLLLFGNMLSGTITLEQQQSKMWQHLYNKSINPQREGNGLVLEGAVTEILLDKYDVVLAVGQTKQLTATVLPEDAYNKDVIWEIDWMSSFGGDDPAFTLSEDGVITAVAEGEGEIVVRAADNNGASTYCTVRIVKELAEGEAEDFTGTNHDWDN
jgi:hypothetical protein